MTVNLTQTDAVTMWSRYVRSRECARMSAPAATGVGIRVADAILPEEGTTE